MIKINSELINSTIRNAEKSERKREVHLFHQDKNDTVQRFINAIEPESAVEPHYHESTFETFIAIKGKVEISTYNPRMQAEETVIISPCSETVGVEIPPKIIHSFRSLEKGSVVYIVMRGPYDAKSHKSGINLKEDK